MKSGSLKLLEPSGPLQACNGIALPFTITTTTTSTTNVITNIAATVADKSNSQRIFEADELKSASLQLVLMSLGYTTPHQHGSGVCNITVDPCLMKPVFHHLYSNCIIC